MERSDVQRLERRLRRVYELTRLRRALLEFVPVTALIVAALLAGGRATLIATLAPALFGVGVLALWYGREPARGVLPGILAGGAALVLVLCANHMGHACAGAACVSWCVPACIGSGVLAGAVVGGVGVRARRRAGYWLTATALTLLTGSLGCSCVGNSGIAGLVAGFGVAAAVALLAAGKRSSGATA